jgi:hypothetical protein
MAADGGDTDACKKFASAVYQDRPYAREIGHVWEAAGVATSNGEVVGEAAGVAMSAGEAAREVVGEASGVATFAREATGEPATARSFYVTSAGVREEHGVPSDVLTDVLHWLHRGEIDPNILMAFRRKMKEGNYNCYNDGCEVQGHLKDLKVCPQCKTARYCGDACQKQDWTTGGHKATCGTWESKVML